MKTDRYIIYVGLNDGDSRRQEFETERLKRVLYNVCKNYSVSFSVADMAGGYFLDNGQFIQENSMQISLIGSTREITEEISADICAFFNQESVLIVHDEVDSYLVRNKLDK